jgi:DNA-binding transcriptional LysR family regulator
LNSDYYYNFVEIVKAGTISAAARKLSIAQPALSNQIKALENYYGAKLLVRSARSLALTDAGKALYDKAETWLLMEDNLRKEIDLCVRGYKGILRIGISTTMPDVYIENLLLDFGQRYPQVVFDIYEATKDALVNLLREKVIEVAVFHTNRRDQYPFLHTSSYIPEKLMAVYRRDSQWLSADTALLPIPALKDVPISCSKGLQKTIAGVCFDYGLVPFFKCTSATKYTALLWCRRDAAVSIVPSRSGDHYENAVYCCRPFEDEGMAMDLCFSYLKNAKLSAVAQMFLIFGAHTQAIGETCPDPFGALEIREQQL